MIYRVYSDLQSFKTLVFTPGLNVVLAEKTRDATDRQTRNGAGKSSIVEILRFLFGGNADPTSIFRNEDLIESTFGVECDLGNTRVRIERSGASPSKISCNPLPLDPGLVQPSIDKETGLPTFSVPQWRSTLRRVLFDLDAPDEETALSGPTFNSVFSYFARRRNGGGFDTAIKQSSMQQPGDYQVALSFLMGLDWTIAEQWQPIRVRERQLRELRNASKEGAFGAIIGSAADLRTQLAVLEEETKHLRGQVREFNVLPLYRAFEDEAADIARQLGDISDANTIDLRLRAEINTALEDESPPQVADVSRLYEEAGVVLSESVRRRFDEVRAFHSSVVRNRRSYLAAELEAIQRRIGGRDDQRSRLASRQREITAILRASGALDQYTELQGELGRKQAETEAVRQRFETAEQIEGKRTELEIERRQLQLRLQQDYREQGDRVRHAIVAFQELSSALYENAGQLTIRDSMNGPEFDLMIQGKSSAGINNMQIFCFDLMLSRLCAEQGIGPGFLIHDSHLFDGVDERQKARALQIGSEMANRFGFQYIVTFNSDDVPSEFPQGFVLRDHVVPVELTDATETGGLFGIRFG